MGDLSTCTKRKKDPTTYVEYQKKRAKYTGSEGLHHASPKMKKPKPPPNPDQTSTKKIRPAPSKRLKGCIDHLRQQARDLTPKTDDPTDAQSIVKAPAEHKDRIDKKTIIRTYNLMAEEKRTLNVHLTPEESTEKIVRGKCASCCKVGINLPVCSRCHMTDYCNPECQQNNWAYHGKIRRRLRRLWWGNRRFID